LGLVMWLPSVFRRRRGFLRLGAAQLGAAKRRSGGCRGGNDPAPAFFRILRGRERASEATRRVKQAKTWFALGSWGQRDLVKTSR
jgi:hypothetical protein